MKKVNLFILAWFVWSSSFSQVIWLTDLDQAMKVSLSTGKLMVIDFWASWCGPCTTMDRELWNNDQMKKIAENFIGVKINVDYDRRTASHYGVTSIPKLVIALCNGEMIWEQVGFSGASEYLEVLNSLPVNLSDLFKSIREKSENEKDPALILKAGIEYQKTGKNISSRTLRESFLTEATYLFRKAGKSSQDNLFKQKAELYSVLTDVYRNNARKALNAVAKGEFSENDKEIAELLHFTNAICYKRLKEEAKFLNEKEKITNEEFLAELNKPTE